MLVVCVVFVCCLLCDDCCSLLVASRCRVSSYVVRRVLSFVVNCVLYGVCGMLLVVG